MWWNRDIPEALLVACTNCLNRVNQKKRGLRIASKHSHTLAAVNVVLSKQLSTEKT